jgi:hypothetical protein
MLRKFSGKYRIDLKNQTCRLSKMPPRSGGDETKSYQLAYVWLQALPASRRDRHRFFALTTNSVELELDARTSIAIWLKSNALEKLIHPNPTLFTVKSPYFTTREMVSSSGAFNQPMLKLYVASTHYSYKLRYIKNT